MPKRTARSRKTSKLLTDALRASIVRAARRYGAPDADDVAQLVLIDCLARPWLAMPRNIGALMQRTRFHVLHALLSSRRFEARAGWRYESFEMLFGGAAVMDEQSEGNS